MKDTKKHWENIYQTKVLTEVSWYQKKPETSLSLISELNLKSNAAIIDVGGGDSYLVDHLLAEGYSNITVLDISEEALDRAKERLGKDADNVSWIAADASQFQPQKKYDLWHDRAAFHFLTKEEHIRSYLQTLERAVKRGGAVILGTFSEKGPTRCSGIEIKQYSVKQLSELLSANFQMRRCFNIDHATPSGSIQNFSFCSFIKLAV